VSGHPGVPVVGFHHVGILVQDFAPIRAIFARFDGVEVDEPVAEPGIGYDILWVRVGSVALEFLRPRDPASAAGRILATGGGGVHHIALEVQDIDGGLAELTRDGVTLRDAHARPGAMNSRIAFLAAAPLGGTEIELVQESADPARSRVRPPE
jgi:methylmalonyl-CoA/ethylmalonyl-CoA epimerase